MKITKANALHLWNQRYGNVQFAKDFHGNLMCRSAYGNDKYYIVRKGQKIKSQKRSNHECGSGISADISVFLRNSLIFCVFLKNGLFVLFQSLVAIKILI